MIETNANDLWSELKLSDKNCSLWHLHWPITGLDFVDKHLTMLEKLKSTPTWNTARKIFLISQEAVLCDIYKFMPENVYIWESVLGVDHPRFFPYLFWFDWTKNIALETNSLACLTNPLIKPPTKFFDCLLGQQRLPRDIVFNELDQFKDCAVINYFGQSKKWLPGSNVDQSLTSFSAENWLEETRKVDLNNISASTIFVNYQSQKKCTLSVLLPYDIYNDTWFSVINETDVTRHFFTEKTAKALLAKRLFIFFGPQYGLERLRNIGFKTFSHLVNESYDAEPDLEKRFKLAIREVEKLCSSNLIEVYKEAEHILEHNQRLLLSTSWEAQLKEKIIELSN